MAIPNETLVEKAVATTDALASAGKLNPEQAEKFLDYVVDLSVLKNLGRVVRFRSETWEADKIGIGRRNAVPASEAKDPGVRRGVTTSKITLTPREIMVPFEMGDNFREINVEGDSVEEHIVKLMATAVANDLEELYITGDTLGAATLESDILEGGDAVRYVKDSYLALSDGVLKKARSGNVYDAGGANIGASVFSQMIQAMPVKFRRNRQLLRWLAAPDLWQLWLERVSTRATMAGDAALAGGAGVAPFGIQGLEVPMLPMRPAVTEHLTLANAADVKTLQFAPIQSGSEIVVASTLGGIPTAKLVKDTDYEINYTTGAFNKKGGGGINDGATIKITYNANPQLILTNPKNIIIGIGRDIRIEKARDIWRRTNQYAITCKVAIELEEVTACVMGKNIGTGV